MFGPHDKDQHMAKKAKKTKKKKNKKRETEKK